MESSRKRHENGGLRKVCRCPRRARVKCKHPWHVNVTINGVHIRKSLAKITNRTITGKTEAEAAFEAFKVQLRKAPTVTKDAALTPPMTLGAMLDAYQRDELSQKPAAEDTETMIAAIKRTRLPVPGGAQAFGDWLVNDVTEAQLWAYKTARSRKTPARRTDGTEYRRLMGGAVAVNRDLQLIRRAYNWALSARPDDVQTSPFKTGKPPKGLFTSERPRSRRLQGDETERLLRACGETLRPLVEAALETGCRQGELLTLQWGEVNLRDVKPEIRLTAEKTNTRIDRTIPVSTRLRPILEMRRYDADGEPHPPDAYVFGHSATGEPLTTIKTAWRLAMKRSAITDLHFHDLRREAASRWLDAGVRLTQIQKLLGHTTTEQTATYLASALDAEHDAIAAFDAHRDAERERELARQREAETRLQIIANEVGKGVQNGVNQSTVEKSGPQISSENRVLH